MDHSQFLLTALPACLLLATTVWLCRETEAQTSHYLTAQFYWAKPILVYRQTIMKNRHTLVLGVGLVTAVFDISAVVFEVSSLAAIKGQAAPLLLKSFDTYPPTTSCPRSTGPAAPAVQVDIKARGLWTGNVWTFAMGKDGGLQPTAFLPCSKLRVPCV